MLVHDVTWHAMTYCSHGLPQLLYALAHANVAAPLLPNYLLTVVGLPHVWF